MKSFTIHKLEDDLEKELDKYAKENALSLNKAAKKLLRQALGIEKADKRIFLEKKKKSLRKYSGIWSDEEHAEFVKSVECFDEVDSEEWA